MTNRMHPALLPWPDEMNADRMWDDGSCAAWAYNDGSWIAIRPGRLCTESVVRFKIDLGDALEGKRSRSDDACRAARAAADAALAKYLAGVDAAADTDEEGSNE